MRIVVGEMSLGGITILALLSLHIAGSDQFECGEHQFYYNYVIYPYDGHFYQEHLASLGVVYHRKPNSTMEYACGGTLISQKHVLTARICATNGKGSLLESGNFIVRMGIHEHNRFKQTEYFNKKSWLQKMEEWKKKQKKISLHRTKIIDKVLKGNVEIANAQYRHVLKIHQPVDFDENSRNEIIILELSDSVELNEYVQPICIQTSEKIIRPDTVVGWNKVDGSFTHVEAFPKETKICGYKTINKYYNQTEICIKDRGSIGISMYPGGKWYIEGIIDCTSPPFIPCKEVPNFKSISLMPIHAYKGWILNVTDIKYLRSDKKELRNNKRNKVTKKFKTQCGQRPVNNPEENFKFNQLDPYLGQWPWYGTVYHWNPNHTIEYACGCTLISEKHVITTKICVSDANRILHDSEEILVRFGTHIQNYFNFGYAQYRKVSKIHQPSNLTQGAEPSERFSSHPKILIITNSSINTIIILELKNNVNFNEYVQPICIEKSSANDFDKLIGWDAVGESKYLALYNYPTNFTYICTKDRGSIFLHQGYDGWLVKSVLDCMNTFENNTFGFFHTNDYMPWITNITNLDYLQIIRKGKEFDKSKHYPKLLSPLSCGQTFAKYNESDSIAKLYKHPWIAQIVINEEKNYYFLGTLISHRYVLTIASKFGNIGKNLFVRLGDYEFIQDHEFVLKNKIESLRPVRDYDVEYVVKHQSYIRLTSYNIALVRTKKVVLFEDHIHPVCLPVTEALQQLELSEYIFATRSLCSNITFLQEIKMKKQNCSDRVTTKALCVRRDNLSCRKEGAPLGQFVKFFGERFVQFGIYLNFYYNSYNENIVFTSVSHYMDWIEANMEE